MVDTSHINLLDIIGNDTPLKKVAATGGGEYHGPCPFCGGTDRFLLQPFHRHGGRWSCRQCSPRWQDAIAYVMRRDNLRFKAVVTLLELKLPDRAWKPLYTTPDRRRTHPPGGLNADNMALNDPAWQEAACQLAQESRSQLWNQPNRKALEYLNDRGLSDTVIDRARLGYNPVGRKARWGDLEVWLPRGIVIPWQIQGHYWRMRFRQMDADFRPVADPKYSQVKGSANGLYGFDVFYPGCTVMLVESEFDSLVVQAHAPELIEKGLVPIAIGGTNNARLLRWVVMMSLARRVLLAFDVDQNGSGDQAAAWWAAHLGDRAVRLRPTQHDVTDMVTAGANLGGWIGTAMN